MRPLNQINVIPFIDIMLVLLAVVLTTATFVAQGRIPIDLPEARDDRSPRDARVVELTITSGGALFLADAAVHPGELAAHLHELPRGIPIRLRVDASAAFEHFVGVIDLLKQEGLRNVSVVTRQRAS